MMGEHQNQKELLSFLKNGERIDQLLWNNLEIIQNPSWFCFGLDSILLANFAQVQPQDKVLDLCSGSGVIPLLLSAKEPSARLWGIEIFPEVVEMAQRSILHNQLAERVQMITGDISHMIPLMPSHQFQVVTVNPPYFKKGKGKLSSSPIIAAAKTEIYCDLSQVIAAISYHLAEDGRFYLVYPYSRLAELLQALAAQQLQVTHLQLVKNLKEQQPFLCLVSGKHLDNIVPLKEISWSQTEFVVFAKPNQYTQEMQDIYTQKFSGAIQK